MPRSCAGLLFFLGTFGTSLLAVGFADRGHQSSARPADLYRVDVDETADGWNIWCDSFVHEICIAAAAEPTLGTSTGLRGSEGWIAMIVPGSPLVAMLYIDDDSACRLACLPARFVESGPAVVTSAFDGDSFAGCVFGPWDESSALCVTAETASIDACDELGLRNQESDIAAVPADNSPRDFEDLMLLEVGAAYAGPLPSWLVWQYATQLAGARAPAWSDCDHFPDRSLTGWLEETQTLASAPAWRAVGRAARSVVLQILEGRELAIATVSRQIVGCISWPLSGVEQATPGPSESIPGAWPNARFPGVFLAL